MIENIELVSITTITLILTLISLYPLIYLKYFKDLNNNIVKYNTVCDNKNNVYNKNNIKIKNTYMWNMSTYLFDFNKITTNFNYKSSLITDDAMPINRYFSIVNGKFNIMRIYNDYLHYSIALFIILWLVFLLNIMVVFSNYSTIDNAYENNKNYMYSAMFSFINVITFTIIFSLILKKITEIYIDTDVYNYIVLLKELDIIIQENNVDSENNKKLIDLLKKYSENDEIKSIADIYLDKKLFYELKSFKGVYFNNYYNYNITLQHVDNLELYNSKKTIKKINEEIDDVTQYIVAYFILIFMSIFILSQAIKSNFIIISVIIILMYIFYIFSYVSKKKLE